MTIDRKALMSQTDLQFNRPRASVFATRTFLVSVIVAYKPKKPDTPTEDELHHVQSVDALLGCSADTRREKEVSLCCP